VTKVPEDIRGPDAAWKGSRLLAGKYRLGRIIGEGGMGAVYEAEHTGLGARVAVKLLNPSCAANERAVLRFRREARAAAAVRHDNIVAVTDTDTDENGVPFIVMEILDGESLSAWIQRQRVLDTRTAVTIANQILAGLAAAHERKVIHRDLKPGNVVMARQRDGTVKAKILDFGISKFLADEIQDVTATSSVVGTPRFMSPEQALGQRDVDGRADLYAVGEMLYVMTTGRLPFTAATMEELSDLIVRGDFPRPREVRPELSPALEAVILRAMHKDRELRYPDANAMLEALRAAVPEAAGTILTDDTPAPMALADAPPADYSSVPTVPPTPPTGRSRAAPPARRHVGLAAATVAVGLVAALAAFLVWRGLHAAPSPAAAPRAAGLTFGISRYLPAADVEHAHAPFVAYLARSLGRPVRLVVLEDYLDPARAVLDGELDLAALSAYTYVRARARAPGLRLLATPVTSGGSSYEGVVLVRADSGLRALTDLAGKRMCWVSQNSTSGYLYARALFRRAGVDPDTGFAQTMLTGDHLASLRALRDDACDGAAVFSGLLFDAKAHGVAPDTFRIVASTDRIPYDAYVMSPSAPDELVASVGRALLALAPGTPEAAQVFDGGSIIGLQATTDAAYDPVRAIASYLDEKKPAAAKPR
jgi:serine/threonine-protein kinase